MPASGIRAFCKPHFTLQSFIIYVKIYFYPVTQKTGPFIQHRETFAIYKTHFFRLTQD